MKRLVHFPTLIILGLALLIQSCDTMDEHDIAVFNDTDFSFSVYLDGVLQFKLAPGGSKTIKDVEYGSHTLDARVGSEIVAERVVYLDHDIEWTIYVETYDLTVINSTRSAFSVYLDGLLQFELYPGDIGTIANVSEGIHTVDARIGSNVIAEETLKVYQDTEWEVYD